MVLLMKMIVICISGVFGWDFNIITSKVFVTCVRQLNTVFLFNFLSLCLFLFNFLSL